jgi:hypothetical protein
MLETQRGKTIARCLGAVAWIAWLVLCLSSEVETPTYVTTPENAIKSYAEMFGRIQIGWLLMWPVLGSYDGKMDGREAHIFVMISVLTLAGIALAAANYVWSARAWL